MAAQPFILTIDGVRPFCYLRPALIPQYDGTYSEQPARHPMRYVYFVCRYGLMTDLFQKLNGANQ